MTTLTRMTSSSTHPNWRKLKMRSSTEVIELRDQKLLLPLEVLKTELGFASLYFGLLLGIKASEMLDNPWLLGVWVSFLLGTLLVDLFRDQSPRVLGPGLLGGLSWNLSQSGGRLRLLGATLITLGLTLLLIYSSEAFFSKVELLFRVIY